MKAPSILNTRRRGSSIALDGANRIDSSELRQGLTESSNLRLPIFVKKNYI